MYLVYLGLPRPETHTTGAAAAGAALATIGAAAGARTGSSGSGTSSSLASAAGATLLAHDARSGLGLAAGGIAACLPRHCAPSDVKLILVLLPQYTLYLCIWLCIWCVSASKTETHRYTRIRTPHPVYLTSRVSTVCPPFTCYLTSCVLWSIGVTPLCRIQPLSQFRTA